MIKNKKIISGIQSTGNITIGNYIGAIRNVIGLQENNEVYFFVADLHSLTTNIEEKKLKENKKNIVALLLALGADPKKMTIFYQSDISEHSELFWILSNFSYFGELKRMTQFKDKALKNKVIKVGLFTYPILMASDILLYNAEYVPVGKDQKQHMELVQKIANRFNNKFGKKILVEPKPIFSDFGKKIVSLTNPNVKMSKSDKNVKSYISLFDNPDEAYKKILKAVTDSENKVYFDFEKKPGVSNLLTIYSALEKIPMKKAESMFKNSNYLEFKETVAKTVKKFLIDLQKKYHSYEKMVDQVTKNGASKMQKIANKTLTLVKKVISLN